MNSKIPFPGLLNQYLHVSNLIILQMIGAKVSIVLALIFLGALFAWILSPKKALPIRYLQRNQKASYHTKPDWKGTPVDRKGRFVNEEFPFYQNYLQVICWVPSYVLSLIKNSRKRFPAMLHENNQFLERKNILIWLGHASFYLNLGGVRILIDPLFYSFKINKRHTPAPISSELFTGINYILISHDHYDHCDKKSLRELLRNNPGVTILSGLQMRNLIQSFANQPVKILTADWYQQFPLDKGPDIYFVPGRHYCNRLGQKYNGRLWGGFMISHKTKETSQRTIYFGGDSGAAGYYRDLKELFHPELAIMGIGAYKPRWFMHPNHNSPQGVLQAFDDTAADALIPMHYGTYNLSNENMEDPLRILLRDGGNRKIVPLIAGQIYDLNRDKI